MGMASSVVSTRDLNYFFHTAASLYKDSNSSASTAQSHGQQFTTGTGFPGSSWQSQIDLNAVLVLGVFRQTLTHIKPIAERFHLGPADRQPLYGLTAQPSPRSAAEFNELSIRRRDPVTGVWHAVCTSDIEPCLDLSQPGHYKVASLVMDAVPVWKRVVGGQVQFESSEQGKGNKLRLWWGDVQTLGVIGDAYTLWWESGSGMGNIEAFYLVQWGGFDNDRPGVVTVNLTSLPFDAEYSG
jgi:hypothetical protein